MNKRIVGIDVGLDGGYAFSCPEDPEPRPFVMPTIQGPKKRTYDIPEIMKDFKAWGIEHAFLERAQAMPGQGVSSMFSIGRGFGIFEGLITAMGIPLTVVGPQTWQKIMLGDTPKGTTKTAAAMVCARLWPLVDFRASDRCKKRHDGMCDAALIGEYGRRIHV